MYFTRTNPMMRDKNTEAISTTVALKAECACEGRRARMARVSTEGAPARG
jgi:hypothetical protein